MLYKSEGHMQKGNKYSIKQNKVEYHWEVLFSDHHVGKLMLWPWEAGYLLFGGLVDEKNKGNDSNRNKTTKYGN